MGDNLLQTDKKGIQRCWWCGDDKDYQQYHDEEWGRVVTDDIFLFEKICLEGFQSGLSWLTILRKRDNFRQAFDGFDFNKIATYTDKEVARLMADAGIVRNLKKIQATINNAQQATAMVTEFGSLAHYFWQWEPTTREPHNGKGDYDFPIPSVTKTSQALAKDLKKRGWKFVGPTTAYAFMQAMGLVNDHIIGCASYSSVENCRKALTRP